MRAQDNASGAGRGEPIAIYKGRSGELQDAGIHIGSEVLRDFIDGGKCMRSTLMYWFGRAAPMTTTQRWMQPPLPERFGE